MATTDWSQTLTSSISVDTLRGGLLAFTARGILGWAEDLCSPGRPVKVILSVNDEILGSGFADQFGLNVRDVEVESTVPTFMISLAQKPKSNPPFELVARASTGTILGEPMFANSLEALFPLPNPALLVEGMIDRLQDGLVLGWAWSPESPETPLLIDILDGDQLLGCCEASLLRDDLRSAGKRYGRCGFSFNLPSNLLDGRVHRISARPVGSLSNLLNSPISFGPADILPLLKQIADLHQHVSALSAKVDELLAPSGPFQSKAMQLLGDRILAFSAVQEEILFRRLEHLHTPDDH